MKCGFQGHTVSHGCQAHIVSKGATQKDLLHKETVVILEKFTSDSWKNVQRVHVAEHKGTREGYSSI